MHYQSVDKELHQIPQSANDVRLVATMGEDAVDALVRPDVLAQGRNVHVAEHGGVEGVAFVVGFGGIILVHALLHERFPDLAHVFPDLFPLLLGQVVALRDEFAVLGVDLAEFDVGAPRRKSSRKPGEIAVLGTVSARAGTSWLGVG